MLLADDAPTAESWLKVADGAGSFTAAQAFAGEVACTPLRTLSLLPGLGLDVTVQDAPSQWLDEGLVHAAAGLPAHGPGVAR